MGKNSRVNISKMSLANVFDPNARANNISLEFYVNPNINQNIKNSNTQKIETLINEIDELLPS